MSLLEAVSLSKDFQRRTALGRARFAAVSEVDLSVAPGEFVTVTGRSGSGKTTLLTMLAGLAAPTRGSVLFKGRDIYSLTDRELSALRNSAISFIPQGMGLLGNLTVYDNIRAPLLFAGKNCPESDRADFLLEEVGLSDLALEYPQSLSGGEMRRVSIARALFSEPDILIADEPTSDLDPENTEIVMRLLGKAVRHGAAVIVVTHEKEVALCGTRRFFMKNGKLVRRDD